PGFDQLEHGLPGGPRQTDQPRLGRALLRGQAGRRAREVDLRQPFDAAGERRRLFADLLAQGTQDALDLALFLEDQRSPAVGHVDYRQRLDEQGRAAGRLVVHDAGHLAAHFGADRYDVAAIPLRDHRVLDDVAER